MASWVKWFVYKHEGMSLDPQTYLKAGLIISAEAERFCEFEASLVFITAMTTYRVLSQKTKKKVRQSSTHL